MNEPLFPISGGTPQQQPSITTQPPVTTASTAVKQTATEPNVVGNPYAGDPMTVGPEMLRRLANVVNATPSSDGLVNAWATEFARNYGA